MSLEDGYCYGSGNAFIPRTLAVMPAIGKPGYYVCWTCKRELKARRSPGSFRFLMLPRHKRPVKEA